MRTVLPPSLGVGGESRSAQEILEAGLPLRQEGCGRALLPPPMPAGVGIPVSHAVSGQGGQI